MKVDTLRVVVVEVHRNENETIPGGRGGGGYGGQQPGI